MPRFGRFCVRRSHAPPQFAETGQEMEIFIPAVEKRSAIDAITRLIAFLLPMAHAVARALSLSISFHLLLPSAHCLPALYPPSFHFLFLPLAQPQYVCLPIPHPSYETHKSPVSFYFSLSLSHSISLCSPPSPLYTFSWIHRTPFLSMATFALSLLWGPSYSFPRICGQFGAAEPPTDREGTRHTAVPTVPSHFEKYPGKMIRPLLRPGLSLSLSPPRPSPPPPRFAPPWSPSTSSSLFHGSRLFIFSSCLHHRRGLLLPSHRRASTYPHGTSWRSFFLPRNAMRGRNRFIVLPCRFEPGKTRRDGSRKTLRPS